MRMNACGIETKKSSEVRTVTDPETVDEALPIDASRFVSTRLTPPCTRKRSSKILFCSLAALKNGKFFDLMTIVAPETVFEKELAIFNLLSAMDKDVILHPADLLSLVAIRSRESDPSALSSTPLTTDNELSKRAISTESLKDPEKGTIESEKRNVTSLRSADHDPSGSPTRALNAQAPSSFR